MRRTAVLLACAVLGACGDPSAGATDPTPSSSSSASDVSAEIAAYRLLVDEFNGFIRAAIANDEAPLGGVPASPEEVIETVGYDFAEGVTIEQLEEEGGLLCFTGPERTFLTVGEHGDGNTVLRRVLGTGECAYDDGAVIIDLDLPDDLQVNTFEEQVVKGEDVVEQVPGLHALGELMNETMTPVEATIPSSPMESPSSSQPSN